MPDEEPLAAEPVSLKVDLDAIISREAARAACEKCDEEVLNRRVLPFGGLTLCRSCAGGSYYRRIFLDHRHQHESHRS
jgi:formylmethanofuran dehydrogenase subunit E